MERLVLVLTVLMAGLVPPLAASQVPCASLEMRLDVLVESSGRSEAEALATLDREAAAVRQVIDTPCINEGKPSAEPYTDGLWYASRMLAVAGSEADLRGIALSLGDNATPVELVGRTAHVALPIAVAVFPALSVGLMVGFRRVWGDDSEDGAILMGCGLGFFGAFAVYFMVVHLIRSSWQF